MGKRGPKPTPSAALKLRGSWRGDENAKHEVDVDAASPAKPDWLADEALDMWDDLCARLVTIGTIGEIDANLLGRYCATWAEWRKAHRHILKHGQAYVTKDRDGEVTGMTMWPQTRLFRDLGSELSRMEGVMGIGAANRVGLNVTPKEKKTGKSKYFA